MKSANGGKKTVANLMHAVTFAITLASISLSLNCLAAIAYSAEPIEGWVVDAETGKPIQDVLVLAHWQLRGGMERQIKGELMILEARTDANGRFHIPGWGPISVQDPTARLWNNDPDLHFLKSGYKSVGKSNELSAGDINVEKQIRTSKWNGKQIAMQSLKGDGVDAAADFYLSDVRRLLSSGTDCEWKKMPLTVAYLLREGQRLQALGMNVYMFDPRSFTHQDRCGSAVRWVEEILR